MRVVVDTNVVVSAILRDRNPEKAILHLVANPECEWVASEEILAEYREVLRRPRFGLSAAPPSHAGMTALAVPSPSGR
jgi:putative PIN family toxin of toxin-antitoxin system